MQHKLFDIDINGQILTLRANTFIKGTKFFNDDFIRKSSFNGQKILHPFDMKSDPKNSKKTIYDDKPSFENVFELLKSTTEFHIKHDGSCGAVVHNGVEWKCYARFDIKRDKKSGEFITDRNTSNWIPCEDKPTDKNATHWPHFRPCDEDPKAYVWYLNAFNKAKNLINNLDPKNGKILTVEFMGKKFNQKISDPVDDDAVIVFHGSITVDIPENLRNFEGFKLIMQALPVIEGVVAYPANSSPLKIRRELFENLKWPDENPSYLEKYGYKTTSLSKDVAIY